MVGETRFERAWACSQSMWMAALPLPDCLFYHTLYFTVLINEHASLIIGQGDLRACATAAFHLPEALDLGQDNDVLIHASSVAHPLRAVKGGVRTHHSSPILP